MPGWTLRLRSGRKARYYLGGQARKIQPYRDPALPGSTLHLIQLVEAGVVTWNQFTAEDNQYQYQPFAIETIETIYDGGFALTKPAAICLIADRPVFYNGMGVRSVNSVPALSSYYNGVARYYGLDAFCPTGLKPTVAFAAGVGDNTVLTGVSVWVGLWNSSTNHFSNAVLAGSISTTGTAGTITVSDLSLLSTAHHGGTEQSELKYVFYATVDGGQVPYLILNVALDAPHSVGISSTSASLSISSSTDNGWVLDLTKEAPYKNFPPRPMRSICHVNRRLYGSLLMSGSGGNLDFTYIPTYKELAGVVWSAASEDIERWNSVGDPLQCWPLLNIAYTPSADVPIIVMPAQDSVRVLVITPTSTFLLEEVANGIHRYLTVSGIFGIGEAASAVSTSHGICWVTQANHIVMLPPNSLELVNLSRDYKSLITGTVTAADYLFDPDNLIDRYQIWMNDGTSVIHDFALASDGNYGEGYDATGYANITAAGTVLDATNKRHHLIASTGLYTHEAQPEDGRIPTTDETYTDPDTVAATEINGEYRANWTAEGDSDIRKDLSWLDVLGDVEPSTVLSDACPVSVEWYADFEEVVAGNKRTMAGLRIPQTSRSYWRFKPHQSHKFWYKFVLKLAGHSADDAEFSKYPLVATDGDNANNFYGHILELRKLYAAMVNAK